MQSWVIEANQTREAITALLHILVALVKEILFKLFCFILYLSSCFWPYFELILPSPAGAKIYPESSA